MSRFEIFRIGRRTPETEIDAADVRRALAEYATEIGIDPTVRRDGGGLLYVGDGVVGRYRAREAYDLDALADWQNRFTKGQPIGMPIVLAAAIEKVGGLR